MTFDKAQEIVAMMIYLHHSTIGLDIKKPDVDLNGLTLADLMQANRIVRAYNDIREYKYTSFVCGDRLIAAAYTLANHRTDGSDAILFDPDRQAALIVCPASPAKEDQDG